MRDAEELKLKYLDPKIRAQLKDPLNHNESRETFKAKRKQKKQGIVTYVFQELQEEIPEQ